MMDIMALPIKKRGRPKKILTDYEIEEATRAAMYTRPAIEITKVPRVYSAEGLALSRELALDLILKAVESGTLTQTKGKGLRGRFTVAGWKPPKKKLVKRSYSRVQSDTQEDPKGA